MSVVGDSTIIEQLENRIAGLESEIERIRETASVDLQNAHNDLVAKNRLIGQLKAELAGFREDQPESGPTRDLLVLWKTMLGKNARTYIGLDGKRAKIVSAALKKWGQARCEQAIIGLSLMPWSGPHGRAAQEYPGSKRYDDIEHALGDEVRMEKLVAVAKAYERPSLLDEPVGPAPKPVEAAQEPESIERQFVRHVYGDDCQLPHKPASLEPKYRPMRGYGTPPINRVLDALTNAGCEYRPGRDTDSWQAICPSHDDRRPSLSVQRNANGMVWLKCWAGCSKESVLADLGLEWGDLFEGSEQDHGRLDGPPLPRPIPAHLRQAMREMLARDERQAA